ncbi:unnamed protein product [Arctia plantaginis]|uniref:Uncharacterized protein n=1 Tax=Arctia plantaginis TaxID=874455 RepID=A0A8S1BRE0_ARCPL|nr:unnamed protein product [Arctia plantaginis]
MPITLKKAISRKNGVTGAGPTGWAPWGGVTTWAGTWALPPAAAGGSPGWPRRAGAARDGSPSSPALLYQGGEPTFVPRTVAEIEKHMADGANFKTK